MKKLNILLIALVVIVLGGCTNKTTEKHHIDDVVGNIYKVEFEGHTYLIRSRSVPNAGYGGICHDENCKCKTIQ